MTNRGISFIESENIRNLFQWEDVKDNVDIIAEFLSVNEEDNIFVLDKEEIMGIVSIGDVIRYYEGKKYEFLNRKFTYLEECNYNDAIEIFKLRTNIYEIPIIKEKKLKGIIKRERSSVFERKNINKYLEKLRDRNPKTEFLISEINRCKCFFEGIEFYIFQNPTFTEDTIDIKELIDLHDKVDREDYDRHADGLERGFNFEFENLEYVNKNGFYLIKDYRSKDMNIIDNHRVVPNRKEGGRNKIFMFGPCTVFGAYVKDCETIGYYLQEKINKGNLPYEIINCGMLGPDNECNRLFYEKMEPEDKVILLLANYNIDLIKKNFPLEYKGNLSEVYKLIDNPLENVLDCAEHCNGKVNNKIAEMIWKNIRNSLEFERKVVLERKRVQDYYISYDIHKYFDKYIKENSLFLTESNIIGAIVMNCNPFTFGHRYLIEKASKEVDFLYIFVVEEDKSYFKFEDRFEMVKAGISDLENVKVIPSGKYIISRETFFQYFEKDNVEMVEEMDYDIRIFGEVIAKKLNIAIRFVGEEPTDVVTRAYNETMKRILPEYGVKVIEYPRKEINGGVISASSVRKCLETRDWGKLDELIPESTKLLLRTGETKKEKIHHV